MTFGSEIKSCLHEKISKIKMTIRGEEIERELYYWECRDCGTLGGFLGSAPGGRWTRDLSRLQKDNGDYPRQERPVW